MLSLTVKLGLLHLTVQQQKARGPIQLRGLEEGLRIIAPSSAQTTLMEHVLAFQASARMATTGMLQKCLTPGASSQTLHSVIFRSDLRFTSPWTPVKVLVLFPGIGEAILITSPNQTQSLAARAAVRMSVHAVLYI